jgi:triosephosphate isomerase
MKNTTIFTRTKGHSERRTLFHETSEVVAQKTKAALASSISVILCIGETLEQRETNQTTKVCSEQLQAVVDILKEADWRCGTPFSSLSSCCV